MINDLQQRSGPPWWMAPHAMVPALMLPLLVAAWLAPAQFHWELGRMAKFMDFGAFVLGLAAVASLAFGAFIGARFRPAWGVVDIADVASSPSLCRVLKVCTWLLFIVAVVAYVIWFMPVALDPSILFDILAGRWYDRQVRDTIGTIPGVTTLVQAQVPYVTLLALRWLYLPDSRPSRLEKLALIVIFLLACLRNLIWSERIAVIEVLVPLAILVLRKPRHPTVTALAPLFAFVGLFVFFALFEYFRSWSAYYQYQYDSFLVFIIARLSGYYITALDNGVGLVRDWGGQAGPLYTADWFWRFPLEIGQTWLSETLGFDRLNQTDWLYWNATPEFNNTSGIYLPFVDYGRAGGLVFWLLFGGLTGMMYRGFAVGTLAGMLIYPTWFMGLLELPRVLYLCEARYFPVLVITLSLVFFVSLAAGQEARAIVRRPLVRPPA